MKYILMYAFLGPESDIPSHFPITPPESVPPRAGPRYGRLPRPGGPPGQTLRQDEHREC